MDSFKCKIIVGASADGKITISNGSSSKEFQHYLTEDMSKPLIEARKVADAVMVSWKTVNTDNPSLRSRDNSALIRIILDRTLQSNLNSNVFDGSVRTIVITTIDEGSKLNELKNKDVEIICINNRNFLNNLKEELIKNGINNLLVEGGGNLNRYLIENKFVDYISIAYFPFLVGGEKTPTILDGIHNFDKSDLVKLTVESYELINNMLVVNYKIS